MPTTQNKTNMKFEKKRAQKPTQLKRDCIENAESLEQMIRRSIANKEPIESVCATIYTDKKDGVRPEFDIRTDRIELARAATDKFAKSIRAKTEEDPFRALKDDAIKLKNKTQEEAKAE